MPLPVPARTCGLVVASCIALNCGRPIIDSRPAAPDAQPRAPLTQLWNEPHGSGAARIFGGDRRLPIKRHRPPSSTRCASATASGYSSGYDVVGPDGRQWDVKVGKEAQTEIVVSRILSALGYHQPAAYYLTGWQLAGTWEDEGEPARFRLESDHENGGDWAWRREPVRWDARPPRPHCHQSPAEQLGFQDEQQPHLRRRRGADGPVRRYVVQDLGASLGKPRLARSTAARTAARQGRDAQRYRRLRGHASDQECPRVGSHPRLPGRALARFSKR